MLFCLIFVACLIAMVETNQLMADIKLILKDALLNCKEFQKYSDNETLAILLNHKLVDTEDIRYYIFGDPIIQGCMKYEYSMKIVEAVRLHDGL